MDVALFAKLACGRVVCVAGSVVVIDNANGSSLHVELLSNDNASLTVRKDTNFAGRWVTKCCKSDAMVCAAVVARSYIAFATKTMRLHLCAEVGLPRVPGSVQALRCAKIVSAYVDTKLLSYHDRYRRARFSNGVSIIFDRDSASVTNATGERVSKVCTYGGAWRSEKNGIVLRHSDSIHDVVADLCHFAYLKA